MMGLTKLIKNRISSEWKKVFNDNVDYLNGLETKVNQKDQATNSRIDNLVLQSGGDSPNEVVDARVDADGVHYDSLYARLKAVDTKSVERYQQMQADVNLTKSDIQRIDAAIFNFIGMNDVVVDLFVSAEVGSESADGSESNPFKRIQQAVDAIPIVSISRYVIWIEPGVYLEDVMIESRRVRDISIFSVNYTTTNASEGDTDVFLRSLTINNTDSYTRVQGITFVDQANTGAFYGGIKCAITFDLSKYVSIQNCRFAENTKSLGSTYSTVVAAGGSSCAIGSNYMANQSICLNARYNVNAIVNSSFSGGNNGTGFVSMQSVIRVGNIPGFSASTIKTEQLGGQVLMA